MEIVMLLVFTIYVILSGVYIIKKNILFGGVYFFLFIYSIFTQIGYYYFPEISQLIHAYFGVKYFYYFYIFNFLSFISFFTVFYFGFPYLKRIKKYSVIKVKPSSSNYLLFLLFLFFIFTFLLLFSIKNWSIINYGNNGDQDFVDAQGVLYKLFVFCFKFLGPLNLILYGQLRSKINFPSISFFKRNWLLTIVVCFILMEVIIANKIGSRTDIVALSMGITIFEINMGLNIKKAFKLAFGGVVVIAFLLFLESTRAGEQGQIEIPLSEAIIFKDYFPPAHMLYAAMYKNMIIPKEVIVSNFCNFLIMLKYPFLQNIVAESFSTAETTRSAGYAFYNFTEGFLFMGYLGFLYNGIVLFLSLSVWYIIQNSNNKYYNYILLSIMCTNFANIARTEGFFLYKTIYMVFVPVFVLIYLSSGFRPSMKICKA